MINPDKFQLLFFFLVSYLLSRVFVRFELPKRLVWWLIEEKHISISKLSWLMISGTAVLSMLIANVVTLMAMIPVLELMQNQYHGSEAERRKFATLMMLSAVWGANIGGMGMLTGTTTNGILVGMFEAYRFPISNQFTFLSWMSWAVPLALLLCGLGWLVLMACFRPAHHLKGGELRSQLSCCKNHSRGQRLSIRLAVIFLVSATLLSSSMSFFRQIRTELMIVSIIWTLLFLYLFFMHKFRIKKDEAPQILLPRSLIFHDLPRKGLMWIMVGVLITAALVLLKFPDTVARASVKWIASEQSVFLLLLIAGAITTFSTELVSNSVIQIAMFMTLFPLSRVFPEISWQMMLIITLTSTCAFMSPIATPSNGLGFGSTRKVSIPHMLMAGMVMNLVSLLLITLWVRYLVPWVLCLFA